MKQKPHDQAGIFLFGEECLNIVPQEFTLKTGPDGRDG